MLRSGVCSYSSLRLDGSTPSAILSSSSISIYQSRCIAEIIKRTYAVAYARERAYEKREEELKAAGFSSSVEVESLEKI